MPAKIEKPMAYFRTVVSNSDKNEYRSQHNAGKHLFYAGSVIENITTNENRNEAMDEEVSVRSVDGWLAMLEDPRLHRAMLHLSETDQKLLFLLYKYNLTQQDVAIIYGVGRGVINRKVKRIHFFLKNFLKDAYKKGV